MYYRTFGTKLSHIAPAWALAQPRNSASLWGRLLFLLDSSREWASLVAQRVKNLPAMQEMGFNPWVRKISRRKEQQPTPVFLPGESHGQRSLVGYSPWGRRVSD